MVIFNTIYIYSLNSQILLLHVGVPITIDAFEIEKHHIDLYFLEFYVNPL